MNFVMHFDTVLRIRVRHHYYTITWDKKIMGLKMYVMMTVLRSRSRKERHHLAGAMMQRGSGSDGSGSDNGIKHG
jgi:hypothetical protein